MSFPFRPFHAMWGLTPHMRLARSGPLLWASDRWLDALERRRRCLLVVQQKDESDAMGGTTRPPKPRPPSSPK